LKAAGPTDLGGAVREPSGELTFRLAKAMPAGSGQAQVWDAASGRVKALAGAPSKKGTVRLPLVRKPCETKFIGVGPLPLSTAIHKCGYVSNGRKKSFDRITGFTGFFPETQEKSC
jgi:hypothetical protein